MAIFRNQHIIQPTTVITIIFTILQKKSELENLSVNSTVNSFPNYAGILKKKTNLNISKM